MMLRRRKAESSRFVYTHISYSLLTFSMVIPTLVVDHLRDGSMNDSGEKNVIESVELVARIVRSCREKMDASNRLSPRGVSTPGALFPLFPRDLTYLSFHWYCVRTATDDDDKSRESLAWFCWKTSKQSRGNDTPHCISVGLRSRVTFSTCHQESNHIFRFYKYPIIKYLNF